MGCSFFFVRNIRFEMLNFGPFDRDLDKIILKKWLQYNNKCAILIMKLYRPSITMPFRRGRYVYLVKKEHKSPGKGPVTFCGGELTKISAKMRAKELEETR